jgi:predicted GNAT family acetyltransferase
LADWRVQYAVEALGAIPTPKLFESSRNLMLTWLEGGNLSLLSVGGEVVSMTGFNASARGIVQVGNVYTPAPWRGRGYARAAVAGSLLAARAAGAVRSTLFTGDRNPAAQRAYRALGYQAVGDYGILLF